MLRWHRLCVALLAPLLAYVVFTGVGIQLADMVALVSSQPDSQADMQMMRQHIDGPDNYSVVRWPDYSAQPIPASVDVPAAITRAAELGRSVAPRSSLRLVEIRMVGGRIAGHVQMDQQHVLFDLDTGQRLEPSLLPPAPPGRTFPATRASFKYFHRFNYLGQIGTALNLLAAIGFSILIVTGLFQYARLFRQRRRLDRRSPMWRGGGWLRQLHRWTSTAASVLIIWLVATGLLLSLDNVGALIHGLGHPRPPGFDPGSADFSSPIKDADLGPMTGTTLSSFREADPGVGIKVLRLRYFAGYPQGVIVAADSRSRQLVFNSRTGQAMAMWEKGYPDMGFPSGWEWHQRIKQLHRGDYFGMPGRWLDTIGALALLYLLVSGLVMYGQLWSRRRRAGRSALVWK